VRRRARVGIPAKFWEIIKDEKELWQLRDTYRMGSTTIVIALAITIARIKEPTVS